MRLILAAICVVCQLAFGASAFAQQNQLGNGDFEANTGGLGCGDNTLAQGGNAVDAAALIVPWQVLNAGLSSPNLVQVDGPGGPCNYSTGPNSDAAGSGATQHYLDIVGSGDFFQSFVPVCDGEVEFGAYFSNRVTPVGPGGVNNLAGNGQVDIYPGSQGPSGNPLASSQNVAFQSGTTSSQNSPWKLSAGTAVLTKGQIYSFVVRLTDNVNVDNAYVYFVEEDCELCCDNKLEVTKRADDSGSIPVQFTDADYNGTGKPAVIYNDKLLVKPGNGIPITEIRASVSKVEFTTAYEACEDCNSNPALWGSLVAIQNIGALQLEKQNYTPASGGLDYATVREVIWSNPNGTQLPASGVEVDLLHVLNPGLDIPCCQPVVNICTKISWKDANGGLCETEICNEVGLTP